MYAAGIERETRMYRLHIFRRTVWTLIDNEFGDLNLVQGILGHSSIPLSADVYVQQSETKVAKATDFLAKEICAPTVPHQVPVA